MEWLMTLPRVVVILAATVTLEIGEIGTWPHRRCPERHVSQPRARLRLRKGHRKAIGAVARHLAEAAFQVLAWQQPYQAQSVRSGRTREV